jgi:D-sedoheptulose 7-phosphate isomerase
MYIPRKVSQVEEVMKDIGQFLIKQKSGNNFFEVRVKKGKELVSDIDIQAEKLIIDEITKIFPDYKIWSEELGREEGETSEATYLIIDSINGTKNYLSDVPLYTTQIACLKNGVLLWGIIIIPELNESYVAIRGKGAFLNGKRIHGTDQRNLGMANQCFGLGQDATTIMKLPKLIKDHLAEPRSYGSASVHFAFMASGRIDLYIAEEAGFYDCAPGIILCQEAGLGIYDFAGKRLDPSVSLETSMIVTSKHLIKKYKKQYQPELARPYIDKYFWNLSAALNEVSREDINALIEIITETILSGGAIYVAGNGGSAAIASHFSGDLNKTVLGSSKKPSKEKRLRVTCLNDNIPLLTAWANDCSYDAVFSEPIKNYIDENDLLIVISSSGNSENIVNAVKVANSKGAHTFGMLGFNGGKVKDLADSYVLSPVEHYGYVEDTHMAIVHLVTEYIKRYY